MITRNFLTCTNCQKSDDTVIQVIDIFQSFDENKDLFLCPDCLTNYSALVEPS